uniref:C-X-C motif chemokine n=1 Tax=Junco hyemalis TaxID=40217 RepID=A0A8C5NKB6_JUNHY
MRLMGQFLLAVIRGSEGSSRLPGAPLAGELRCRCVRTVSEVIPPRRLARLEFLAEGPHCAVPEVIATTKKGLTICLDPVAPWVKLLVTRILRRYVNNKSAGWHLTLQCLSRITWE